MLSMDASDLDVELVSNSLEFILPLAEIWKSNVDRGSESSTQVCWTRCNVAQVVIMSKAGDLLDL